MARKYSSDSKNTWGFGYDCAIDHPMDTKWAIETDADRLDPETWKIGSAYYHYNCMPTISGEGHLWIYIGENGNTTQVADENYWVQIGSVDASKFVTTDTAQTITANKSFTKNLLVGEYLTASGNSNIVSGGYADALGNRALIHSFECPAIYLTNVSGSTTQYTLKYALKSGVGYNNYLQDVFASTCIGASVLDYDTNEKLATITACTYDSSTQLYTITVDTTLGTITDDTAYSLNSSAGNRAFLAGSGNVSAMFTATLGMYNHTAGQQSTNMGYVNATGAEYSSVLGNFNYVKSTAILANVIGSYNTVTFDAGSLSSYQPCAVVGTNNTMDASGFILGANNVVDTGGDTAVLLGYNNITTASHNALVGIELKTKNEKEWAFGFANLSTKEDAITATLGTKLTIGDGVGSRASVTTRKNLLEVRTDNKWWLKGIGGYDGTNAYSEGVKDLATILASAGGECNLHKSTAGGYYIDEDNMADYAKAVSLGYDNASNAEQAISLGTSNIATGKASLAIGVGTKTANENEMALGAYNHSESGTAFSIGSGTEDMRINALELDSSHKLYVYGIGDYTGTNRTADDVEDLATYVNQIGNLDDLTEYEGDTIVEVLESIGADVNYLAEKTTVTDITADLLTTEPFEFDSSTLYVANNAPLTHTDTASNPLWFIDIIHGIAYETTMDSKTNKITPSGEKKSLSALDVVHRYSDVLLSNTFYKLDDDTHYSGVIEGAGHWVNEGTISKDSCVATGNSSHAGGVGAQAIGNYSFTHGFKTTANNANEVAFGTYNKSTSGSTLLSYGIGTSSASKNVFEVDTNGKVYITDIGGYTGDNYGESNIYSIKDAGIFFTGGSTGGWKSVRASSASNDGWAFGSGCSATAYNAAAFGGGNTVSGQNSAAFGAGSNVSGEYCFSMGQSNVLQGTSSYAFGAGNYGYSGAGGFSFEFGTSNRAYGGIIAMFGSNNESKSGLSSCFITGYNCKIYGDYNFAGGYNTYVGYDGSTTQNNSASFAYGQGLSNFGSQSAAFGLSNSISTHSQYGCFITGRANKLADSGTTGCLYSTVVGYNNTVTADTGSFTEGYMNKLLGATGCHMEGYANYLTDGGYQYCHIEGSNNKVTGGISYAHVEGTNCSVKQNYGHAEGNGTTVDYAGGHAEGTYNYPMQALSYVGTGNSSVLRNSIAVMPDGKVYVYGVGSYTGQAIGSAKDLATAISEAGGTSEEFITYSSATLEIDLSTITKPTYYDCGTLTTLNITHSAIQHEVTIHFTAGTGFAKTFTPTSFKVLGLASEFEIVEGKEYELSIKNDIFALSSIETAS